jgi:rsbT co-antagonist protein RsbR
MTKVLARFFDLSIELLATADSRGFFVDLNPAWSAALGFSLEELRQKPFIEFVHPDDRESTLKAASRIFTGEVTVNFENRYQTKDGDYKWLSWTARLSAEDQLIFACARDITDYKNLLAERDRFKALADSTTDFVGMAGLDGRVTYLNSAGKRLLGDSDLEIDKLMIAECHPPEHAATIMKAALPAAAAHGTWIGDGAVLTRDGRLLPVSQVVVALKDARGTLRGFGTIIRDLSVIEHFKRLERELRNQQESLHEMLHAMSTPIIPLTDHILVMPVIGTMDSQRAEQFLETALLGAQTYRAQVIIIDITGLRHIDTSVAGTLVRAALALRLIGAQVVLTGMRAELASTLVKLGLDLSALTARGTLKSGIAHALHTLGESLAASSSGPRL